MKKGNIGGGVYQADPVLGRILEMTIEYSQNNNFLNSSAEEEIKNGRGAAAAGVKQTEYESLR